MSGSNIKKAEDFLFSILKSYSQIFFSESKLLAVILLLISFFDYGAGIGGLVAVVIANLLAGSLGYNRYLLNSGLYGFNSLLVGLGVGLFYQPSLELFILIGISAVTCFFLTVVFQGLLGKYGLPYLSVPFLFTIWIVSLSGESLTALNISQRGIYVYNELYSIGGKLFVDLYEFLEKGIGSSFIRTYFHSLGAIFFQSHLLAGILIALGLLIYSRITFVLSILGYSVAYLFYLLVGIEFNSFGYTYIGFNYILTAIALGGFYLVPGRVSYAWIVVLLPAVVLITQSTQQISMVFKISSYSLPFNMVVLMFLYSLKLREKWSPNLIETPVQMGNPEKNLYLHSGNTKRFPAAYPVAASLPFYGEWKVSQGHNGDITHKGPWQHAWDFIIADSQGNQFKGKGDYPEDYYCFGKTVLAPFEGSVVEVVNNIPDNSIGDINTKNNWGNTVIIKHNYNTFSKLCHLKFQSVEVKPGDNIKKGQVIGRCGNSGRSPYPHLHFQFQGNPFIGSPTIRYPLGHYLLKEENRYSLKAFDFPLNNQLVANPLKNELLAKALHFIPGQRIKAEVKIESQNSVLAAKTEIFNWLVGTDIFNTTYIQCEEDGSRAYIYNSENLHYFTNYSGVKNTALYWFSLGFYMVPLGFLPNSKIKDSVPANMMFSGMIKFLQDFIAPVYLFLKVDYDLVIKESGDILSSGDIRMHSTLTRKIAGKEIKSYNCGLIVKQNGQCEMSVTSVNDSIKIVCSNELE